MCRLASAKPEREKIVNQQLVFGHGGPLRSTRYASVMASNVAA